MSKVYCRDCKWYRSHYWLDWCVEPGNIVDSFFAPSDEYKDKPRARNANNDCPGFAPHEPKPKRRRWWQGRPK